MKTVLITGSNGFVGNHLVRELTKSGESVIGLGGPIGASKPSGIKKYFVIDLMDRQALAKAIDFRNVDGIIHLAGLAAVGPSFDNPLGYIQTNTGLEINLFEAALAQKASPRFLIISSGNLYDGKASQPLLETSMVLPNSPYAISKLGQEQLAYYYGLRGFECIVARPFNHIGPGQGLGFVVPDLTKQVIEFEKGKVKEILVGNLDAKRDYTDVRDIARAYRLLLETGRPGEIYNVCSGVARSGHEILESLLKLTKLKPEIKKDPAKLRPSDSPVVYGSHQKLTSQTGWQPEISLETTLSDVIEDWRQQS